MNNLNVFSSLFNRNFSAPITESTTVDRNEREFNESRNVVQRFFDLLADFFTGTIYSSLRTSDSLSEFQFFKDNIGNIRKALNEPSQLNHDITLTNGAHLTLSTANGNLGRPCVTLEHRDAQGGIVKSITFEGSRQELLDRIDDKILEASAEFDTDLVETCMLHREYVNSMGAVDLDEVANDMFEEALSKKVGADRDAFMQNAQTRKATYRTTPEFPIIALTHRSGSYFRDNSAAICARLLNSGQLTAPINPPHVGRLYQAEIADLSAGFIRHIDQCINHLLFGTVSNQNVREVTAAFRLIAGHTPEQLDLLYGRGGVMRDKINILMNYYKQNHGKPVAEISILRDIFSNAQRQGVTGLDALLYTQASALLDREQNNPLFQVARGQREKCSNEFDKASVRYQKEFQDQIYHVQIDEYPDVSEPENQSGRSSPDIKPYLPPPPVRDLGQLFDVASPATKMPLSMASRFAGADFRIPDVGIDKVPEYLRDKSTLTNAESFNDELSDQDVADMDEVDLK
jgi:hypothetical protein